MVAMQTIEDEREVRRFAGVIEPRGSIRFRAAPAKDHQVGSPPATLGLMKEPADVMRSNRPLESVEKKQARRADRSLQAMHVNEVSVRGVPAFHVDRKRRAWAKELAPQSLAVGPRYPPCGAVGILASSA